ncbi:probable peptidyl-tRNA hydrolase 2 [Dendronephthya gigantea]|uniref:probable peptidyl-tRNA hydrolase 2 n=1 Tax=Dendronephthya gigantea TaxID=151771 RepID=UPI00106912D5|nr:probable peptidyl-tRNA hydrolase 2 [Dendronephthya gigantea]
MDIGERTPAEGIEGDKSPDQANAALGASGTSWSPNEEYVKALIEMGVSRNAAEKGLYYTGNVSAEIAAEWVFENIDHPELNDPFQVDHSLSGFTTVRPDIQSSHRMVFVVNSSLKMGVGKVGAQVGHAAIGLYRELLELRGQIAPMLAQWGEDGETKVVVKAESTQAVMDIENQAMSKGLPTFLVTDAGMTQVAPGSVTVLGLFGEKSVLGNIVGHLKLL